MSSTYATLEVSSACYAELSAALRKVGYSVERAGEINMEGIHVVAKPGPATVLNGKITGAATVFTKASSHLALVPKD